MDKKKTKQQQAACAALLNLSSLALINMTVASKGRKHVLPALPMALTGMHTSPGDLAPIPASTPAYLRQKMAWDVGSPEISDSQHFDCKAGPWNMVDTQFCMEFRFGTMRKTRKSKQRVADSNPRPERPRGSAIWKLNRT